MTQRTLAESLAAYADSDYYPFHMPGHKRRLTETLPDFPEALQRAARLDITEIDGFDNLHDPEGILKDAEERRRRCMVRTAVTTVSTEARQGF